MVHVVAAARGRVLGIIDLVVLRRLRDENLAAHPTLTELSMGMSNDLEVAIEEGATWVRVGTALFGPRPSKERNAA